MLECRDDSLFDMSVLEGDSWRIEEGVKRSQDEKMKNFSRCHKMILSRWVELIAVAMLHIRQGASSDDERGQVQSWKLSCEIEKSAYRDVNQHKSDHGVFMQE